MKNLFQQATVVCAAVAISYGAYTLTLGGLDSFLLTKFEAAMAKSVSKVDSIPAGDAH